ncbi:MAG: hypothetical protein SCARUB_03546 [Candidatus Scalindua rubra]|uniref:Lipoprotein n=1 Tax=Candidatus Scalindua rubra TaxID=1872076 RepID=A0A1E3X6R9_9BACT|nr:MAG: hypothetical protein SCARUB_03546 [Candidatus Scalindua rubra]
MDIKKLCLSLVVSCMLAFASLSILFTNVANAIEFKPSRKDVNEAVKFGELHSGTDILKTVRLKQAIYGNWPNSDGGFIKSKLIRLSVSAAMNAQMDKKLTEEDINEILKSDELEILGNAREELGAFPKKISIKLKQGDKVIKPKEMRPGIMRRENWTSVYAVFPYSSIDPMAKTKITFRVNSHEREYELDFSKIK